MKGPFNRTKVVIRHLPPAISQTALMEQIDGRFSDRYKWLSFRPGKNSQKNLHYSRAYIDFHSPEDVVEFAEFFDGHIFVNEKGTQFKAVVEYAPSQHVPMVFSKKDGREGTIFKDPEYVEFLEYIAKPVENLPSAEIQLERREAERAGGPKEAVIVTSLMDFIRQKRAAKSGSQRSSSRRAVGAASSRSSSSKQGSEKRRGSSSVCILRDSEKTSSTGKDKTTYILVSRKEVKQSVSASSPEEPEVTASNGTIIPISSGCVKVEKKLVLLKGQEREASIVSSEQLMASGRYLTGSTSSKQSQRHAASGRIIRSILSQHKDQDDDDVGLQSARGGSHRHIGRRGSAHGMKEVDAPLNFLEGKPSKRGVCAGYGSYERQVWVQKSGSGS